MCNIPCRSFAKLSKLAHRSQNLETSGICVITYAPRKGYVSLLPVHLVLLCPARQAPCILSRWAEMHTLISFIFSSKARSSSLCLFRMVCCNCLSSKSTCCTQAQVTQQPAKLLHTMYLLWHITMQNNVGLSEIALCLALYMSLSTSDKLEVAMKKLWK